jgi:glutamyl/glutaminyl-tRNA synthetase
MEFGLRTRLAPTPSGYLHLGNLANFLLIEKLAAGGATLHRTAGVTLLRIDDCDGTRTRPEFVRHIFETLAWLGIRWQEGPRDEIDFQENFSQTNRKAHYFAKLAALNGRTFACACTRKEAGGGCSGACRGGKLSFRAGEHALRLRLDDEKLHAVHGDPVLWRKDDGPAYHWASVIDDLEARINLIVRGEDLRESSELQRHLAKLLTPGGFSNVRFVHHPLLTGEGGKKLAKSQNAPSVRHWIAGGGTPEGLREKLAPTILEWANAAREL